MNRITRITIMIFLLTGLLISFLSLSNHILNAFQEKINYESFYAPYVLTNKETQLYSQTEKTFEPIGKINTNVYLELEATEILNKGYFKIKNLNQYIYYEDIIPTANQTFNQRFLNYLPFNENVIINNMVTIFNELDQWLYELPMKIDSPIIKKDGEKIYFNFHNQLVYVNQSQIAIETRDNYQGERAQDVPVLMYHFFYSKANQETGPDNNWIEVELFDSQMNYLSENQFLTLTMNELEQFLEQNISLPKNSIVITIDDGNPSVDQYAYPILEKHQLKATSFLITSWEGDIQSRKRDFIELHSHSHDMHKGGCSTLKGGLMQCIDFEAGVNDLNTSSQLLDNSKVFCYPFGDTNDQTYELLTTAGFHMAFTTKGGRVSPEMDKLLLPRVRISANTSVEAFIGLVT